MTKKFTINCDFGGQTTPFNVYIGKAEKGHHPLQFQADWLSKNKGGTIPTEIMNAVTQLQALAEKNAVPLEDLCVYALGSKQQQNPAVAHQEKHATSKLPSAKNQGSHQIK